MTASYGIVKVMFTTITFLLCTATTLATECYVIRKSAVSSLPGAQIIESPNYFGSSSPTKPDYPINLDCTFTIKVADNYKVYLRFDRFELEDHPFCEYDSLTVYDGDSESADVIGKFCGLNRPLPPAFTSSSNRLTFRFKTDGSGAAEGFRLLAYEREGFHEFGCGGSTDNGQLIGPAPGAIPLDCVWNLHTTDSSKVFKINIFLIRISTDGEPDGCVFTGLEFLDGNDRSNYHKVVDNKCGNHSVEDTSQSGLLNFTTTTNSLRVRYYTSTRFTSNFFWLLYAITDRPCGGDLNANSLLAALPNLPASSGTLNCRWTLRANDGNYLKLSHIHFSDTIQDCTKNYVVLRDLSSQPLFADDEKLSGERRLCGTGSITKDIISDSSNFEIYVRLEDASSVQFGLNYQETGCSRTYTATDGVIRSPGYPIEYPQNMDCVVNINMPSDIIVLNINQIDMELSKDCQNDYVEVHDGNSLSSPTIAKLCGLKDIKTVTSSTNNLTLHFVSNGEESGHGFEITYTSPFTRCGGRLSDSYGTFYNPANIDGGDYFYCIWQITLPVGMKVNLTFSELNLQPPTQANLPSSTILGKIEVRDGTLASDTVIGTYINEIPDPIVSSTNELYILFEKLDLGGLPSNAGFTAHYTALHTGPQPMDSFDYNYDIYVNGQLRG